MTKGDWLPRKGRISVLVAGWRRRRKEAPRPERLDFDALAVDLARGLSRRQALARLGGALLGALAASLGIEKAWAACAADQVQCGFGDIPVCCPPGQGCMDPLHATCGPCTADSQCATGQLCCGGVCQAPCGGQCCGGACCNQTCFPAGWTCCAAVGVCPPRQSCCGDQYCADLQTDVGNCGACGFVCRSGQVCVNGQCSASCPGGQVVCDGKCCDGQCLRGLCVRVVKCPLDRPTDCNGACVNTNTDPNHCGSCDFACQSGLVCVGGQCSGCPEGQVVCNGKCCSGQCLRGVCVRVVECPPDRPTVCDGACVNTSTNPLHCGACNVACAAGQVCVNGQCSVNCPEGGIPCGAVCCTGSQVCVRNPITGLQHCTFCLPPQVGCHGVCRGCPVPTQNCCGSQGFACCNSFDYGETCCDGACCPAGQHCENGVCQPGCVSDRNCVRLLGQRCCGNVCVNVEFDPNNCGDCGVICPTSTRCEGGSCCGAPGAACVLGSQCCSGTCHRQSRLGQLFGICA